MSRSLFIVLGAVALCVVLFVGSFALSQRVCRACAAEPPGGLRWLQSQYHLNNEEMARIQKLHNGYLLQCDAMCRMITAKQQAVEAALNNTTNINPVAQQKLDDLAACRIHCQSQILQYFISVSQSMPAEQGRQYLADMEKNALSLSPQ
jgi:spore coat protein CotF